MKTSRTGYALIKAFEGFRAQAALLPDERWVMGYGHTVFARAGAQITRKDAADLLIWDVRKLEPQVRALVFAPLTQNQYDALIALTFNIGIDHLKNSDVLRRLNEGCPVDAAAGFDVWRRAVLGGKVIVVDALVRRRAAEKALFLTPQNGTVIAPTPQLPPVADDVLAHAHNDEEPLDIEIDLDVSDARPLAIEEQNPPPLVGDGPDGGDAQHPPVYSSEAVALTSGPVAEVAEKIGRYLDNIGTGDDTTGDDVEETQADRPSDVPVLSSDDVAEFDELTMAQPVITDADGDALQPYDDQDNSYASWSGENEAPFVEGDEVVPETMVVDARQTADFHPAQGRGFLAFILFAILGLAAVLIGVWQTRLIGQVTTLGDLLRGPALAVAGVLFIIAAGYNLLRRLGR